MGIARLAVRHAAAASGGLLAPAPNGIDDSAAIIAWLASIPVGGLGIWQPGRYIFTYSGAGSPANDGGHSILDVPVSVSLRGAGSAASTGTVLDFSAITNGWNGTLLQEEPGPIPPGFTGATFAWSAQRLASVLITPIH